MVRLQKFLADAGVASRRSGEQMIRDGRVRVDGAVVTELGTRVAPGRDEVILDDKLLHVRRKIYIALHKPKGYICTRRDEADRKVILDLLPKEWAHLAPVGRLDRESEGLIFLTNDGDFCLKLTHPRYGVRKTYEVHVEGKIEASALEAMRKGIQDKGERLRAEAARLLSANNTQSVFEIELGEGRNREIRRMCAVLGFVVLQLKRIRIGPIRLGELPLGKWRTLTETERQSLLPDLQTYENELLADPAGGCRAKPARNPSGRPAHGHRQGKRPQRPRPGHPR